MHIKYISVNLEERSNVMGPKDAYHLELKKEDFSKTIALELKNEKTF